MSLPPQRLPVAGTWFSAVAVGDGVTLITEPHVDEFLRANIWHVRGRDADLLVDTGNGIAPLRPTIEDVAGGRGRPVIAVATHSHSDHMGGMHEFEIRLVHRLEAADLELASDGAALVSASFGDEFVRGMKEAGYELSDVLLTAVPTAEFDPAVYTLTPAQPTRLVEESDVVDLGDRAFAVLHLPGHSPGSIGLWEEATGTLFSGDAVYDGPLLDDLPGSDVGAYLTTLRRLRGMPVRVVHAGHDTSFGRERLVRLADDYVASRSGDCG